jgi:hypothetical protein
MISLSSHGNITSANASRFLAIENNSLLLSLLQKCQYSLYIFPSLLSPNILSLRLNILNAYDYAYEHSIHMENNNKKETP